MVEDDINVRMMNWEERSKLIVIDKGIQEKRKLVEDPIVNQVELVNKSDSEERIQERISKRRRIDRIRKVLFLTNCSLADLPRLKY